jgi:hypothetical protein
MSKDNIIIWQKWFDPFGEDEDIDEDIAQELEEDAWSDDTQYTEEYDTDTEDKKNDQFPSKIKMTKVIATPMGLIPVNENTASGKIFNFWVGHTNFNITKLVSTIIEKTPGIECLDIFTRYRFRIAIGKAFNSSEVMKNVQDSIYHHISNISE